MTITRTIHVLSQEDGQFIGALEHRSTGPFWDFWTEDGIDTIFHSYEQGESQYAELADLAASELGVSPDEIYLTDENETEILCAL